MSLGAALSAGLAASLLSGSSVKAEPFVGAAPADTCRGQTASTIFVDDFTCIIGDKVYSSFENLSSGAQFTALQNASFSFTNEDPNFSISLSPASGSVFTPGIYSFAYSMTVFDALASGERIKSISTSAASSSQGAGNPDFLQSLTAIPTSGEAGTPKEATFKQTLTSITTSGAIDFDNPVISADFISILDVKGPVGNGNSVFNLNNSVIQLKEPGDGETVPGPLPILGAGVAFGLSRKLRSRIRQTS